MNVMAKAPASPSLRVLLSRTPRPSPNGIGQETPMRRCAAHGRTAHDLPRRWPSPLRPGGITGLITLRNPFVLEGQA